MMEDNIKDMRMNPESFVDANAAGTYLKLHPVTVQRFARMGSVPAHPIQKGRRKHWRFLLSELEDWLKGSTGE